MAIPSEIEILRNPDPWMKNFQRHGLYRATVVSLDDPQKRGRIQVRITLLHPASAPPGTTLDPPSEQAGVLFAPPGEGVPDDSLPWADAAFPWGGNSAPNEPVGLKTEGFFALPSVGSTVWVGFDQGFIGRPVWIGSWLKIGDLPEEVTDPKYIRLMKTPGGHLLIFDDTPNQTKIKLATLAQNVGGVPHTVRVIELNDQSKKLTIQNTEDEPGDPRSVVLDATAKKTTIFEGTDRKIELDQTGQKNTIQQKALQSIVQDGLTNKTVVTDGTHTITLDTTAGSVTISAVGGASTIILTAASVTITVGGVTMTFDGSTGNTNVTTGGNILLGTGATLGVVLDAFFTLYNAHVHSGVQAGAGNTGPPTTTATPGVHSSATVKAKL